MQLQDNMSSLNVTEVINVFTACYELGHCVIRLGQWERAEGMLRECVNIQAVALNENAVAKLNGQICLFLCDSHFY